MQITFDIPNEHVERVVKAVNARYPLPPLEPGTYTPAQWAKEVVRRMIVNTVRSQERDEAMRSARDTVNVPDEVVGNA